MVASPVDVPPDMSDLQQLDDDADDNEIVHFDTQKQESRDIIKRLYSFLSIKKNTKKPTKPIVTIPT